MLVATRIVALHLRPDLMDEVAALITAIWPDHYGAGTAGDAISDILHRNRAQGLRYGVLALDNAGAVAGTAALSDQSYGSAAGETLWLTGLCVRTDMRCNGLASQMIRVLQKQATSEGHRYIHTTTNNAAGLMRRLGWQKMRSLDDETGHWQVLRKTLETGPA